MFHRIRRTVCDLQGDLRVSFLFCAPSSNVTRELGVGEVRHRLPELLRWYRPCRSVASKVSEHSIFMHGYNNDFATLGSPRPRVVCILTALNKQNPQNIRPHGVKAAFVGGSRHIGQTKFSGAVMIAQVNGGARP
jgi:hypothetical protein